MFQWSLQTLVAGHGSIRQSFFVDHQPNEATWVNVIKVNGPLFRVVGAFTSDIVIYALISPSAASRPAWRALARHQKDKRLLRTYFRHVSLSFRCRTKRLLNLPALSRLHGTHGKRHVALAFAVDFPRCLIVDLSSGQKECWKSEATVRRRLYITDWRHYIMWRLNLLSIEQIEELIVQWSDSQCRRRFVVY
jgi:hypothetical protein